MGDCSRSALSLNRYNRGLGAIRSSLREVENIEPNTSVRSENGILSRDDSHRKGKETAFTGSDLLEIGGQSVVWIDIPDCEESRDWRSSCSHVWRSFNGSNQLLAILGEYNVGRSPRRARRRRRLVQTEAAYGVGHGRKTFFTVNLEAADTVDFPSIQGAQHCSFLVDSQGHWELSPTGDGLSNPLDNGWLIRVDGKQRDGVGASLSEESNVKSIRLKTHNKLILTFTAAKTPVGDALTEPCENSASGPLGDV